ncbi:MAG TPA: SURF1 family protein [Candidatus Eisenbacteria bacterium]|jgi:surfeit locus 1 family protein
MKPRTIVATVLVLAGAGLCVRLGFWQISRWHEKQALNAALRAALAGQAIAVAAPLPASSVVANRRIEVAGVFDESRQVLLSGRVQARLPGVEVVTPLVLPGDSVAVLVDRGWLYAPDAARARPQDFPERGPLVVRGIARTIALHPPRLPWLALERDSARTLWSAHALDPDSLAPRFPYALAPWLLIELPGPRVPEKPLRSAPHPYDEFTHVSYAIQWFLFAAILLGGSAALAWSKHRARPPRPELAPLDPLP